jgi:hypothetical protein
LGTKITKKWILLTFLFLPCVWSQNTIQTSSKTISPKPSLDLLVARVDRYWRLLLDRKRVQAASFILSSDRDRFSSVTTPQFRAPQLKSLELSSDRNEATVTVIVKRIVPPFPAEMNWPVVEKWRFEKGTWYRRYDPQSMPILGSAKARIWSPADIEAARLEIRKKIHFEKTTFDFGTVNQGKNVVITAEYKLDGTDPLPITLISSVPSSDCPDCTRERGINLMGAKDPKLLPGKEQELSIEVPTWNYDGSVEEKFTLVAKLENIEVPIGFKVQGRVYTPLTISPKFLSFREGEREKEIIMKNNSQNDLRLEQFLSETHAVTLHPFPVVIPPGEQRTFTVRTQESANTAFAGALERTVITYAPVDGFSGNSYKVYLNIPEEKPEREATPMDKEIQKIIRRNRTTLPIR